MTKCDGLFWRLAGYGDSLRVPSRHLDITQVTHFQYDKEVRGFGKGIALTPPAASDPVWRQASRVE